MSYNKRYLFLCAWVDGSETAMEIDCNSKVSDSADLIKQFNLGNEDVFAVEVFAPNEDIAMAYGYKKAFFENYTAHDSVSTCKKIASTWVGKKQSVNWSMSIIVN